MRVIGLLVADRFLRKHGDLRQAFLAWHAETESAQWRTPAELKERFPSVSIISGNRVVFNLKGNSYRLDCRIYYRRSIVHIVRLGTHADYNSWLFDS
jgi:mRNA interferase HigB